MLLAKCVEGHENEYIQARLLDQEARRNKYGNSACMQEPNIKNGCGGLRDYQNLLWMAYFKDRTRTPEELEKKEVISAAERKQLESAYDFLLRTRNELQYLPEPRFRCPEQERPAGGGFQLGLARAFPQRAAGEIHEGLLYARAEH